MRRQVRIENLLGRTTATHVSEAVSTGVGDLYCLEDHDFGLGSIAQQDASRFNRPRRSGDSQGGVNNHGVHQEVVLTPHVMIFRLS